METEIMPTMNTQRVALATVAAAVVINVVETVVNLSVLAGPMEEMLVSRNLPPMGGAAMGGFVVLALTLGFLVAWTYAAIRPRLGAGPGTALRAGLVVWTAFYLLGTGANWLMGIVSLNLFLVTLAYTLPMMLAAGYVAGMVYKES
jgi:hypothetical protein